jgi:hypothetical protein
MARFFLSIPSLKELDIDIGLTRNMLDTIVEHHSRELKKNSYAAALSYNYLPTCSCSPLHLKTLERMKKRSVSLIVVCKT